LGWAKNLSIRHKLLLVFLPIILVMLLTVGLFSYNNLRRTVESNMSVYTRDVLTGLCERIEIYTEESGRISFLLLSNQDIQNALELADSITATDAGSIVLSRRMNDILLQSLIMRDNITYIEVVANNGTGHTVVFDRQHIASYHKLTKENMDTLVKADGALCWFDANPDDGLILAGRIINSTKTMNPLGYMTIAVKESSLRDLYSNLSISSSAELFIINSAGSVISHPDRAMLGSVLEDEYIKKIVDGDLNEFRQQIKGTDSYVVYSTVPSTGWKVVSVTSENLFMRQIINLRESLLVFIAVAGAAVLVVVIVVSSTVTKPVLRLSRCMELVDEGSLDVVSDYVSNDEIGAMSRRFNQMMDRIKHLIKRVETEELLKNKAELMFLRMQVNPHFLYNTLESINWAARAKGADDAAKMVKALGDLMRTSIGGEDHVTLERELENINNYILLQNYRFKDRFTYRVDIADELLGVMVPSLIIQPLLENSLIHGFKDMSAKGSIVISGKRQDDDMFLWLKDDGAGIAPEELEKLLVQSGGEVSSERIGLWNVHRRIQLHCGIDYGLSISSVIGKGTTVEIHIPFQTADPEIF
jgi:two-component system sensor histidine kinase YesM